MTRARINFLEPKRKRTTAFGWATTGQRHRVVGGLNPDTLIIQPLEEKRYLVDTSTWRAVVFTLG